MRKKSIFSFGSSEPVAPSRSHPSAETDDSRQCGALDARSAHSRVTFVAESKHELVATSREFAVRQSTKDEAESVPCEEPKDLTSAHGPSAGRHSRKNKADSVTFEDLDVNSESALLLRASYRERDELMAISQRVWAAAGKVNDMADGKMPCEVYMDYHYVRARTPSLRTRLELLSQRGAPTYTVRRQRSCDTWHGQV
jgi:hypothetical protein